MCGRDILLVSFCAVTAFSSVHSGHPAHGIHTSDALMRMGYSSQTREWEPPLCKTFNFTATIQCERSRFAYNEPDPDQCDKYYNCDKLVLTENLCEDGLVFDLDARQCTEPFGVDCSSRPRLQAPKGTGFCFRKNGHFKHEDFCDQFVHCQSDHATVTTCPMGLIFDDKRGICEFPDVARRADCMPEDILRFKCPANVGSDQLYPKRDDCRFFFRCLTDGFPRLGGCEEGLVFSPEKLRCDIPKHVPGCESYYLSKGKQDSPNVIPSREPAVPKQTPSRAKPRPAPKEALSEPARKVSHPSVQQTPAMPRKQQLDHTAAVPAKDSSSSIEPSRQQTPKKESGPAPAEAERPKGSEPVAAEPTAEAPKRQLRPSAADRVALVASKPSVASEPEGEKKIDADADVVTPKKESRPAPAEAERPKGSETVAAEPTAEAPKRRLRPSAADRVALVASKPSVASEPEGEKKNDADADVLTPVQPHDVVIEAPKRQLGPSAADRDEPRPSVASEPAEKVETGEKKSDVDSDAAKQGHPHAAVLHNETPKISIKVSPSAVEQQFDVNKNLATTVEISLPVRDESTKHTPAVEIKVPLTEARLSPLPVETHVATGENIAEDPKGHVEPLPEAVPASEKNTRLSTGNRRRIPFRKLARRDRREPITK